jgi:hypothetical protein
LLLLFSFFFYNFEQTLVGCDEIGDSTQCTIKNITGLSINCVWVISNEVGECEDVSSSCNEISNKNKCETLNSTINDENIINCYWLKERSTTTTGEEEEENRCMEKV